MEILKRIAAGCFILLFAGCSEDDFCNCLKRTGSTITESRDVPAFSKIQLNNNIDLEVIPDTQNSVFITCGENLIDGISVEVEGETLVLRNNNKCNWLRDLSNKFTARVHVKNLNYLLTQGSGDIVFLDTLRHSPFLLECSNGTGIYKLLFNSVKAELKLHSGPADLFVHGYVQNVYFYSGANGYINAENMNADTCTVSTYSTGDCRVYAKNRLDANIEYMGDVFYRGSPVITRTGNGSGKLLPL